MIYCGIIDRMDNLKEKKNVGQNPYLLCFFLTKPVLTYKYIK